MIKVKDVMQVITSVEEHLSEELSLDQLADQFHYSKFYFTHFMKAVMKENIIDYQRKRKLTIAAEKLLSTDLRIIDIAFLCGYQSQEAFTRSFKAYFGITPRQYQKQNNPYYNLYKYPLTEAVIQQFIDQQPTYPYKIVHRNQTEIIGILYYGKNKNHEVSRIFNQAVKELHLETIYDSVEGLYGLEFINSNHADTDDFYILVGINSRCLPKDIPVSGKLVRKTIPESDYAVFELTSSIEHIRLQIHQIWFQLMQENEYICDKDYGYEFYPNGFIPNHFTKPAYLYIPVVKKAR